MFEKPGPDLSITDKNSGLTGLAIKWKAPIVTRGVHRIGLDVYNPTFG
jgi:hypothetical protein